MEIKKQKEIQRLVYFPSKLILFSGKDEEDIRHKAWMEIKTYYNGDELRILKDKRHCLE